MEAPGSPCGRGAPSQAGSPAPTPADAALHLRLQRGEASRSAQRCWGGGSAAGRRTACLWFLGNAVEICSIFKILVFPPATHPPSPHSSPTPPSLGVCISGIFQNHFNVNKRLEGSEDWGGQG